MLGAPRRLLRLLLGAAVGLARWAAVAACCMRTYRIRMHAVNTFGMVIHEFDPWFNYRAAEYLAQHGWRSFFRWYDYMSWYPIGRPIGTTIYPGMQFASVWIKYAMDYLPDLKIRPGRHLLPYMPKEYMSYFPNRGKYLEIGPMSLNDVCCMTPAWFSCGATFFTYLLTAEVSGSSSAGVAAAFVMSVIPAHLMRSVAGEYDNECVAVCAFCLVLWLWCRCVRTPRSWPWAVLAGIAYAAAAATWGGYIFINNLIGLHAAVIVGVGRYCSGYHRAYSIYWLIGTAGAMQVPVIGFAPLRSLEQMPSLLVFLAYQMLEACDIYRRSRARRARPMSGRGFFCLRACVFSAAALLGVLVAFVLMQRGVFTPLGARIRGLFLEAQRTGNPLVDSVAEHQPASAQAYVVLLGSPRYLAVVGLLFCWHQASPSKLLVVLYAVVAYHYSMKMSRLMIICGPIVSVLAGFPVGIVVDWCVQQLLNLLSKPDPVVEAAEPERSGGMGSIIRTLWHYTGSLFFPQELADTLALKDGFAARLPIVDRPVRAGVAAYVLLGVYVHVLPHAHEFDAHCEMYAKHSANPMLMFQHRMEDGSVAIIDDYYQGYLWLKKNTKPDARVIAWWDYGYQITGVGNRTSIADGNTWNHEHIATLGKILTSPERTAWNAIRHLADYALVWAEGGHGDDLGKSPHLARIGNSVFPDHCGDDDPMCRKFSFTGPDGDPTPMMAKSFLYRAVVGGMQPGRPQLSQKHFKEAYISEYGLLRIYEVQNVSLESKEWVDNPANRVCDAPGSWYCVGQYPPALAPLIAKRRNFKQLEDFNTGGGEKSAYSKMIEAERDGELDRIADEEEQ